MSNNFFISKTVQLIRSTVFSNTNCLIQYVTIKHTLILIDGKKTIKPVQFSQNEYTFNVIGKVTFPLNFQNNDEIRAYFLVVRQKWQNSPSWHKVSVRQLLRRCNNGREIRQIQIVKSSYKSRDAKRKKTKNKKSKEETDLS